MEINPETMPWNSLYKLMIGSVVPRPIGWISTIDEQGQNNLAPFSFFNVASANPPHVLFCPSIRGTDFGNKDTLNNVHQTQEFVVNIVTEDTAEAMNLTATELPPDVDEFAYAGLTAVASKLVKPARVRESPIQFECKLAQIVNISDQPGGGSIVIGRVVHIHVDDAVLYDGDKIALETLKPVGRLAGFAYTRVTDVFDLVRRPSEVEPKK